MAPFSEVLRTGNQQQYTAAERSPLMTDLLTGRLSRDGFARFSGQLRFVYEALEEVGDALRGDALAGPFVDERLRRLPALSVDLETLVGPDWRTRVVPLPATARYVARIRATASWSAGYIAHHYTRYLGDLSGGQLIATRAQRFYGLAAAGTAFYRFPAIPDVAAYKDAYRARLDALRLDDGERARMIAEVGAAYRCNAEMFAGLHALGER